MNKLTTGADSTLGEHLKLARRFFGEQSKQAAFLRQKIELSPRGEAEEVLISEREMVYILFALDGVKPPPTTLSRKPTMNQPVTTNQPVTPEGKRPPLFAVWATFHQLWGDAHAHIYQKLLWERMQAELQRIEELMTPTAEPAATAKPTAQLAAPLDIRQLVQDLTDAQALLDDANRHSGVQPDPYATERKNRLAGMRNALRMGSAPYDPAKSA